MTETASSPSVDVPEVISVVSSSSSRTAFPWDDYCNRIQALAKLREDRTFVDLALTTADGGKEIAHLTVMSALGDTFTEVMMQQFNSPNVEVSIVQDCYGKNNTVRHIKLRELNKTTLAAIVSYAYTGRIVVPNKDVVWEILKVAEVYQINCIIIACCTFTCSMVDSDNCVSFLRLGIRLKHGKLRTMSRKVIKENFGSIVSKPDKIGRLPFNQLLSILDADDLNINSEDTVWTAISTWIVQNEGDLRLQNLDKLMDCIRYFRLKLNFLKSLQSNILIKDGKLGLKVKTWLAERERCTFVLDGHQLPCGVFPKAARPRIPGSFLFAYGGWKSGVPTMLIETYDMSTNMWYRTLNRSWPQKAYCGIEYYKGLIYTVGGTDGTHILSSFQTFDPVSQSWDDLPDMSVMRCYVFTAIIDDKLYAIGGHSGEVRMKTVEKYNFKTGLWSTVPDMNIARSDGASVVYNGKIYVAGGLNENQIEATVELFDPETETWTMVRQMSSPRTSLAMVTLNNFIYAIGGNSGMERLATAEKYDPEKNVWTPMPDMITRRSTFSARVINKRIFVVGGYNGVTPIKTVEWYDEAAQSWKESRSLAFDRSGLALVVVDGMRDPRLYTYYGNHLVKVEPDVPAAAPEQNDNDDNEAVEVIDVE